MDPNEPSVKPAWLTTEFWLTLLPTVLFLIKAFTGKDVSGIDINGLALLAVSILGAAYTISRAIQKRAAIAAKAMVTNTKLSIEHDQQVNVEARRHEMSLRTQDGQLDGFLQTLEQRVGALEDRATPRTGTTGPHKATKRTTTTRSSRR